MKYQYITDEKEALEAVKKEGCKLKHVYNQTPEVCLAAVQENGMALRYVLNQTPEVCLAAVKQDGLALQYVRNQTVEICLAAVQENGYALQHVHNQTKDICMEAVKQTGWALAYVNEQTPEICLTAVKQNKHALAYIRNKVLFDKINNIIKDGDLKYIDDLLRSYSMPFSKISFEQQEQKELISAEKVKEILQNPVLPYINEAIEKLNNIIIHGSKKGCRSFKFERYYEDSDSHIYEKEGKKISSLLLEKGFKNIKETYHIYDDKGLEGLYKYIIEFNVD